MVLSNRLIPAALHLSSAAMRRRWRWVLPCARGGRSACSFDIAEAWGSLFPGRRLLPALGGTRHVGLGILRLRIDRCRVLSGAPGTGSLATSVQDVCCSRDDRRSLCRVRSSRSVILDWCPKFLKCALIPLLGEIWSCGMLKVKNFVGYVEVVKDRVVVHELDANHGGSWCRSLQDSATVPSWKTVLNLECRTHTEKPRVWREEAAEEFARLSS